jgi:hypothetical protein
MERYSETLAQLRLERVIQRLTDDLSERGV